MSLVLELVVRALTMWHIGDLKSKLVNIELWLDEETFRNNFKVKTLENHQWYLRSSDQNLCM